MRVRGYHSFQTINPNMPDWDVITWKDWVLDDGVFDNDRGHFRRDGPPVNRDNRVPPELPQWQSQPMTTSEGGLSSGTHGLVEPLTSSEKVIAV
jgi:hypothetical protein